VENKSGSPTEILLRDGFLQLAILGWLATFALLIYA
jgi:decaprenyl-phosphate phosphoribosyltransferase